MTVNDTTDLTVKVKADDLRTALTFASRLDTIRPGLASVAVWLHEEGGYSLAATDSYRLVVIGEMPSRPPTVLIARADARRLLTSAGKTGSVVLAFDADGRLSAQVHQRGRAKGSPFDLTPVDGWWPRIAGLIPAEHPDDHTIEVRDARVVDTLRGIGKAAGADQLIIEPDGSARVALEYGEWTYEKFATVSDDAPALGLNPIFLADAIDATTAGPRALAYPPPLRFASEWKPVVIRAEDRTVLLMPMPGRGCRT